MALRIPFHLNSLILSIKISIIFCLTHGKINSKEISKSKRSNKPKMNMKVIILSNMLVDAMPSLYAFDGVFLSAAIKLKFNPNF